MEVILLEKIQNLGELGDQVRVKAGYGRNYLVPQKKAVPATPENIKKFEQQRSGLEKVQADSFLAAKARSESLEDLSVTIYAKAGTEGKLYGSVGTAEIAEAIAQAGEEVQKREIRLPEGPVRDLGEHEITVQLHADVLVNVNVNIVAEEDPTLTQ